MSAVDELQLTKKRLQNLRRRSFGLQQLTVRIILKQLTFYLTHPDELEKLKNLPGVLRDKILQVLMKKRCLDEQGEKMEFENLKAIFPLLLSPRTRYIELNGILSFCPDRFIERKIEKVTQWDSAEVVEEMPKLFPKVTSLKAISTYSMENVMPQFNNIRNLHLLNSYFSGICWKYLITFGQKLQSLYFGHDHEFKIIDLKALFEVCPKLEKLSLLNVGFQTPPSKLDFFAELKELEWQIIMYHGTFYGMDGSYSNISAILSAPKLEKVQLESWIFNQTDLSNLKSMIEENRILNNLHTLHVYLYLLVADEADALKSWNNVLKNACALLPKLTDFKFGYRGRIEDPLLTCASTPCNSITEKRVCEMCGVFENEK
ncbi:Hypothetical predicted protein [Cloeon dipterum]|uniref:F-box domain-containing protein n=1 Tax=Cloeon dipterum TaxID=197152 RepID=A0A8S1E1P9_9INSE|nr:Hypothetical predicted protein [Cloeon dipterum]